MKYGHQHLKMLKTGNLHLYNSIKKACLYYEQVHIALLCSSSVLMLWLSTQSRKRCQVTMGEKNFVQLCSSHSNLRLLFWSSLEGPSLHSEVCSVWMKQAPLSVGDHRQGGSFPPIADYREHSYNHCHQTAWWCSSTPAPALSAPCKHPPCSFAALSQCRMQASWQAASPTVKFKTSLNQATSPVPARQSR